MVVCDYILLISNSFKEETSNSN